ncbi:MAG: hypothetical protein PHH23_01625 [Paludibacteraceae bacterium]|nr:hypothetical protein [Paludibacteraceae bacterium]
MAKKIKINANREGYSINQIRDTMTVSELISVLQDYDGDALIYLSHDNDYTFGGIREEDFEEVE